MNFDLTRKNRQNPLPLLFVNRLIDDCRFTYNEFRVLCHFTRRAGTFSMNTGSYGPCRKGVRDIAAACGMRVNTVRKVLAKLVRFGVLSRTPGPFPNDPHHYTVEKMRDWDWDAVGLPKSKVTDEDLHSEHALLFFHSEIDEFGLTAHQLRLLAHISRRAGGFSRYRGSDHECSAGVRSMAKACRMSIDTLRKTLGELVGLNVIERSRPGGRAYADFYIIRPMADWVCQSEAQKELPKGREEKRSVLAMAGCVIRPWLTALRQ